MKGKKFDAVEKHFQEKEVKLRQEFRLYQEAFVKYESINSQLVKENEQLKKENADIKEKFQKLLEYSKLSENDITTALHKDKSIVQLSGLLTGVSKYF